MEKFFTLVSTFGENNSGIAFVIGIAMIVMIWRTIVALARLTKYSLEGERKSAWVTTIMTVLFFVFAVLSLYWAPSLEFSVNGQGIIGVIVVFYTLLLWRFSDDNVWEEGVFGSV